MYTHTHKHKHTHTNTHTHTHTHASYQKRLESFEMWCWRRMEKISWTDHVRNEEVLLHFTVHFLKLTSRVSACYCLPVM